MKIKICPSVLACNMLCIEDEIKRAEAADADILHLDVMDGVYVPNISFGFDVIKRIGSITKLPLDVHMMTCRPWEYLDVLARAGAWNVTVHLGLRDIEGTRNMLKDIRSLGMKASLSVKPQESAELLLPYYEYMDMALVMTVEPGFGGQRFMEGVLHKAEEIRSAAGRDFPVQMDGGIGSGTASKAAAAGASLLVVGTASFGAPDMRDAVESIRAEAEEAYRD